MAQLNITLNQDEILQLLSGDREGAFKTLLQESLNSILKAESKEQLRAEPYERTEDRQDSRNGSRERLLATRIGTISLVVPRHRNQPFKTMIFDNYSRSEASLVCAMAEMVVNGVSTRKVSKVVETLCGKTISKSSVSELCKDLDKTVNEFRNRPLEGDYPFVIVDATYFKVREDHRTVSKALMMAVALNEKSRFEIIGFGIYDKESKDTWYHFLNGLKARGLKGMNMIISDAHDGIVYAGTRIFPDVPWQRCQFHLIRNIIDKAPKQYQEGLRTELQSMFNCSTLKNAQKKRDEIITDYQDVAPNAMECLDKGFDSAMTVMCFPENMRKALRTSNRIERINKELKRRANAIGVFPNAESVLRLMGSLLIEINETFISRRRTDIAIYQLQEIREDHEVQIQLRSIAEQQQKLAA